MVDFDLAHHWSFDLTIPKWLLLLYTIFESLNHIYRKEIKENSFNKAKYLIKSNQRAFANPTHYKL